MKNASHRITLTLALAALVIVPASSFSAQTNTLESIQQAFEQASQDALTRYGQSLDSAMQSLKKSGDLDTYLVVEAEKKRFDVEKTVPTPTTAVKPISDAAATYYRGMAQLLRQYGTGLDGLIKRLMVQDKIDDAKAAKAEKDKAEFMLADTESKLPKQEEKPQPTESKPPIVGTWDVAYEIQNVRRTYEFSEGGVVVASGTGLEGNSKGTWKATAMPKGVLVDAEGGGALELWKPQKDGTWSVAHYERRDYPRGKAANVGVARRQ